MSTSCSARFRTAHPKNGLPEPEVLGLLALMLLHESRRAARASPDGELILLTDQDRSLWDRAQIADAVKLVEAWIKELPK